MEEFKSLIFSEKKENAASSVQQFSRYITRLNEKRMTLVDASCLTSFKNEEFRITSKSARLILRTEKERMLFHVNDKGRVSWDLFVIVLATFNCFSVPYNVAYQPDVNHVLLLRVLILYFRMLNRFIYSFSTA